DRKGDAGMTVGRGGLVGEMALLTETKRASTATACEPSTVMRIPRSLFLKMLEGYPDAARRVRDSILARTEQATREMRKVRGKLGGTDGGKYRPSSGSQFQRSHDRNVIRGPPPGADLFRDRHGADAVAEP